MDCSCSKVRFLLSELIDLRKKAPQDISAAYTRHDKEILKCLNSVKICLEQFELNNYDIIELTNLFEKLTIKQAYQDKELLAKICEQIRLLDILIKIKNCPISKEIDDI